MTTGAPKTAVTVETDISTGAKSVRAMRSHRRQATEPVRNAAGITTRGLDVFRSRRATCGTATPTKLMGPANAVTHEASTLEMMMTAMRKARTLTPMLSAYASPS